MKSTNFLLVPSLTFVGGILIGLCSGLVGSFPSAKPVDGQSMPREIAAAEAFHWLPSTLASEAVLDRILKQEGWADAEVIKHRIEIGGNRYLCCLCDPYSGVTRAHALLFAGGDSRLRLISHAVIDRVDYSQIVPIPVGADKFALVEKSNNDIIYATGVLR